VVDKKVSYVELEQIALTQKLEALTAVSLFDVFESEKLGTDKKSMAMSFTFRDEQKTLTDKEIDAFMDKIIKSYEKNIQAEIRK
jgi:phenylalanyl-tRNA synthetase beta chain